MDIEHPVQQAFINLLRELEKMPLEGTDIYRQLVMVKTYIKQLEEREEMLTAEVVANMKENEEVKKEMEFGKFTIAERAKWTYSPKVDSLNDSLKTLKKAEEETGIAKKEITNYLLVK